MGGKRKPVRVYPCPMHCASGWTQKRSKAGAGWIKVACPACDGRGFIVKQG